MPLPELKRCAAPAKINLFLHVVGRRADGYHLLQSVFQLIDLADYLDFTVLAGTEIVQLTPLPGVPAETDLCVRAARLLQQAMLARGQRVQGVAFSVEKNIPMGGGLGGGSSDAATTLLALNYLWQAGFTRQELMQLGLQLGADVPFFVFGENAFVAGIGEQMQAVRTRASSVIVLAPGVHVPTPQIFSAKSLTRNTNVVKIADFSKHEFSENDEFGKNDLQAVASGLYPQIEEARIWLSQFGDARMSGSGACLFCRIKNDFAQTWIPEKVPVKWRTWITSTVERHPMTQMLDQKQNF